MPWPSPLFRSNLSEAKPITIFLIEDSREDVEFIQHILDEMTDRKNTREAAWGSPYAKKWSSITRGKSLPGANRARALFSQ